MWSSTKKANFFVMLVTTLLVILSMKGVSIVRASAELIVNRGFESGGLNPGWEDLGLPVSPSVTDVHSHSGAYSLQMGYTAQGAYQEFSPTVRTASNLTLWVRVPTYPDVEVDPDFFPGSIWVAVGYSDQSFEGANLVGAISTANWYQHSLPLDNTKKVGNLTVVAYGVYPVYFDDFSMLCPPPPTIESCVSNGTTQDIFNQGDEVYVKGDSFPTSPASVDYPLYVVNDTDWSDGQPFPPRVPDTQVSVTVDVSGVLSPTMVWSNANLGSYDIVVDVSSDGYYNATVDAIDDLDIGDSAGVVVITEYASTALLVGLAGSLAVFGAFQVHKKKRTCITARAQAQAVRTLSGNRLLDSTHQKMQS